MFDDLSEVYEAMIDWPKRLAHEGPFYRRWFAEAGVQRVVDVACGSGRHAAMFHEWGLQVEGTDLSPGMLHRARELFGEPPGLRWVVRGFDAPLDLRERFDAAVCVGNSLALAADMALAERAVRQMCAAVRDGGLVILHVLNLWRLPDGPVVWQKCQRAALTRGESLILKGVHRCGSRGYVDLAVVALRTDPEIATERQREVGNEGAPPAPQCSTCTSTDHALSKEAGMAASNLPLHAEATPLLGFEATDLARLVRHAGATKVDIFGGYQDQPYQRETSTDLIVVARK